MLVLINELKIRGYEVDHYTVDELSPLSIPQGCEVKDCINEASLSNFVPFIFDEKESYWYNNHSILAERRSLV